jgi:hypothetical protein
LSRRSYIIQVGLDRIKRDIDPEQKASQGKQIRDEKKSETSDQRLEKYTWSLRNLSKTGFVAFTLGMAGMGGALADQSRSLQSLSGSDNATGLLPPSNQRGQFIGYSPPERYVPSEVDFVHSLDKKHEAE